MRHLTAIAIIGTALCTSPVQAGAKALVAVRAGIMCTSAAALAKLTLPDGTSKTQLPNPSAANLALKQQGGCDDIFAGQTETLLNARKNTSIVTDDNDHKTYVVPNIDFQDAGAPPALPCLDYDPALVTLTGKIENDIAVNPDGDLLGLYPAIVPSRPLCTKAQAAAFQQAEPNIQVLQLVFLNGQPTDIPIDRPVTITGKLYHQDNGNQMTAVLIEVTAIKPAN